MLTFEEYEQLVKAEVTEEEFDELLKTAQHAINLATKRYYDHYIFESDYEWRQKAYKEALAFQINYFNAYGTDHDTITNSPQSVSLGRTTINHGGRADAKALKRPYICREATQVLTSAGFLYRGVGIW